MSFCLFVNTNILLSVKLCYHDRNGLFIIIIIIMMICLCSVDSYVGYASYSDRVRFGEPKHKGSNSSQRVDCLRHLLDYYVYL